MADQDPVVFDERGAKLLDAARKVVANQNRNPQGRPPDAFRISSGQWVPFINEASEEVPPYACMRVTGSTSDDELGTVILKCNQPSTVFSRDYVFNGSQAVPSASEATEPGGGLCTSGPTAIVACSTTTTPANGDGYGPKPNSWNLDKGYPALATIRGIHDSDERWAAAAISPIVTLLGKTTAAVAANTSTTDYQIYAGTLGSEADAGFTTVPAAVTRFAFGTGAWVNLHWVDNAWEMRPYANHAYAATLGGTLANGASTTVTLSDGRSVSATNYSGGSLNAGTYVAVLDMATGTYMLTGGGGGGGGSGPNDVLEGWVHSPFDQTTQWFLMKVNLSYNGTISAGSYQQIYNYGNVSPTATKPFLFKGDYGKCCRAEYDTNSSVYRADWVECSDNGETRPPSPGEEASMYSYGGQSAHVAPYYSG